MQETNEQSSQSPLMQDPALQDYFDDESKRRDSTKQMFNEGAEAYDTAEALTGLGSGPWYRKQVLTRTGLKKGMRMLDVAIGTGLVAREAVKIVADAGEVIGLDPSPGMLEQARKKLPDLTLIEGYAEEIPFDDDSFDYLSMGYALRHVSDLKVAFNEYFRVLKPGATVCLMEIARPKNRLVFWLMKIYIKRIIPVLAVIWYRKRIGGKLWAYYWDTIQASVPAETIVQVLQDVGFENVHVEGAAPILKEYIAQKPNPTSTG